MKSKRSSIPGWFDFDDLYRLAVRRSRRRGVLVEVGCWKGASLVGLLGHAKRAAKGLDVVGVDHFRGSVNEPAMHVEASRCDVEAECRANCAAVKYPRFRLMVAPSVQAAADFEDASCDLVFLDGSHDAESVAADIRAWRPKVCPGGMFAGHDIAFPGVAVAVSALVPGWERMGNSWLFIPGSVS